MVESWINYKVVDRVAKATDPPHGRELLVEFQKWQTNTLILISGAVVTLSISMLSRLIDAFEKGVASFSVLICMVLLFGLSFIAVLMYRKLKDSPLEALTNMELLSLLRTRAADSEDPDDDLMIPG